MDFNAVSAVNNGVYDSKISHEFPNKEPINLIYCSTALNILNSWREQGLLGYAGTILYVDLTTGKTRTEKLSEEDRQKIHRRHRPWHETLVIQLKSRR